MEYNEEQIVKEAGTSVTLSADVFRRIIDQLPNDEKPRRSHWSWGLIGVSLMAGLVFVFVLLRPDAPQEVQAAPWDDAVLAKEQEGLNLMASQEESLLDELVNEMINYE